MWPTLEYELGLIEKAILSGSSVTYLVCDGYQRYCLANRGWNGAKNLKKNSEFHCIECRSRRDKALSYFKKFDLNVLKVKKFKINQIDVEEIKLRILDNDYQDFKGLNIRTISSTVRSEQRLVNIDNTKSCQINQIIETALQGQGIYDKYVKYNKYSNVYIFNGRAEPYGQLQHNLVVNNNSFVSYEFPITGYKNIFTGPNQKQHNMLGMSEILKSWFEKNSQKYNENIVNKYLLDRMENLPINNFLPTFVTKYDSDIPKKRKKFRVLIFLSSDFEFYDLIPENRMNYESIKTIQKVAEYSNKGFEVIVREHPNNKNDSIEFKSEINSLLKNGNIIFFSSGSNVNSYKLALSADLVITANGSTIGVESSALGKPVISMGDSYATSFSYAIEIRGLHDLQIILEQIAKNHSLINFKNEDYKSHAKKYIYTLLNYGVNIKNIEFKNAKYYYKFGSKNINIRAHLLIRILNRSLKYLRTNL